MGCYMNTWKTKFKPGDRVSTKDGTGIADILHIGFFLRNDLCDEDDHNKNYRKNKHGYYEVTWDVSINGTHNFYNEDDLILSVD